MRLFTFIFIVFALGQSFLGCARNYNYRSLEARITAADYFYSQGEYSLIRGNASYALPYFIEAMRNVPEFGKAYYACARIYEAAGLHAEAKKYFDNAKKYSSEYSKLSSVAPLDFKLTEADLQLIKSVPPPADAEIIASGPLQLEKARQQKRISSTDEE